MKREGLLTSKVAPRLFTKAGAAEYLGMSAEEFRTEVLPVLPIIPIGRLVRFDRFDLDAWVRARRVLH